MQIYGHESSACKTYDPFKWQKVNLAIMDDLVFMEVWVVLSQTVTMET